MKTYAALWALRAGPAAALTLVQDDVGAACSRQATLGEVLVALGPGLGLGRRAWRAMAGCASSCDRVQVKRPPACFSSITAHLLQG